jgi:glycosyltransferase involved in cell wall biosynthesis
MKVRIIDYVGNLGGAARYTVEILGELVAAHRDVQWEMVSHAAALEHYRRLLAERKIPIPLLDVAPLGRYAGLRYHPSIIERLTHRWAPWNISVPTEAASGGDVVWVPWIHRHSMPKNVLPRTVGTVVDVLTLQFDLLRKSLLEQERRCLKQWVQSEATLAAISEATAKAMADYFASPRNRISTIHLSPDRPAVTGRARNDWTWIDKPFLLYPANISVHKNHEALFRAVSAWGKNYPLVLTGGGVGSLAEGRRGFLHYSRRARKLIRAAKQEGLAIGKTLLPLGYVSDGEYYALLNRAWALVTPTLGEGCGLPVLDALQAGVPVICSDLPVIREYVELLNGHVFWIDPRRPETITSALTNLEKHYDTHKRNAMEQAGKLHRRSWAQVASEYWEVFQRAVGGR